MSNQNSTGGELVKTPYTKTHYKNQKEIEVIFTKIKGSNHFFKDKENELSEEIEKYIKEKTALI